MECSRFPTRAASFSRVDPTFPPVAPPIRDSVWSESAKGYENCPARLAPNSLSYLASRLRLLSGQLAPDSSTLWSPPPHRPCLDVGYCGTTSVLRLLLPPTPVLKATVATASPPRPVDHLCLLHAARRCLLTVSTPMVGLWG